jgi:hypothetical protein
MSQKNNKYGNHANSRFWFEYYEPHLRSTCRLGCRMTDDKALVEQASMLVFSNYPKDQVSPPSYRDPGQLDLGPVQPREPLGNCTEEGRSQCLEWTLQLDHYI